MNKEKTFTSMGNKLIHHPTVVENIQIRYGRPISLQLSPTSRCNLNCVFCSNVNRDKDVELSYVQIARLLEDLKKLGLRTVEWTGGGDPTLYPYINEIIEAAHFTGLRQGIITNGILLSKKITKLNLNRLYWVRVSMNCLDYVDKINLPEITGTLGFSYVINDLSSFKILKRMEEHVKKYKPKYVRVVPNCQATQEEQEKHNALYSETVKDWGEPYFYQAKHFNKPKNCWWGYIKPYVAQDGWVYPCSSIVLNEDAERQFHAKYRWCRIESLPSMYESPMIPFPPGDCTHCVFTAQNELMEDLIHPDGMEDFV